MEHSSTVIIENKLEYKKSKGLATAMTLAIFVYIITSSIAFPILCKQFYYSQIGPLNIVQTSGMSRKQIETSYSEVVDYCIGARKDFAVGGLKYSEEGKAHFTDCRRLFILDLSLLAASLIALLCWLIIHKFTSIRCARLKNRGAGFWGSLLVLVIFAVIGALGSINFDKTFVVFHHILFPGKTNWILYYDVDEIIKIFPQDFFMNCAIVIVALIIIQSLIIMLGSTMNTRKHLNGKRV